MMPRMKKSLLLASGLIALASPLLPAADAFTPADLVNLKRVSDPQVSPDGRHVAYVLRETDLGANAGATDLWLLDLGAPQAAPRRLTRNASRDTSPRWSADGRTIYFLSSRSGSTQVWRLPLEGGEPLAATSLPLDVGTFRISPTGQHLVFSAEVFPDCADLECTKKRLDEREAAKASGMAYDQLFVRHWDTWKDGTRSHLFAAPLEAGVIGKPVDLSKSLDGDVPSKPFGDDSEYAVSPDGKRVVFSLRVAGRTEPWSTNFDLFEAAIDGSSPAQNLTGSNPAWDTQPVFLADGSLAYLAMERAGFEADRFHVVIRDPKGNVRPLTKGWDRSVGTLGTSFDRRSLLASADDLGQHALFAIDARTGAPTKLVATGTVEDFAAAKDGIVIAWASLAGPADLYRARSAGATPERLTRLNEQLLSQRSLAEFEQFTFAGWNGETVHGYVMKPHGYQAGAKYPIAFIVHGGPQVSFGNAWSYRWNPQVFAGRGYGVVFIDFHGSPGYGQAFTDSISQDWGGKPFIDLQKGLDAAVAKYSWLDGEQACSLGASYGGFMQNWIQGNWPERFRCIVNHAGIFDAKMMYYTTEELWFDEWEHGGTYYDVPQTYEKWDPSQFVTKWRTPMLVTHGLRDFRVPYTQGLAAFTAMQRRGIESRFVVYPDENHWVLKPANSLQWHDEVLGWLDAHLKEKAAR